MRFSRRRWDSAAIVSVGLMVTTTAPFLARMSATFISMLMAADPRTAFPACTLTGLCADSLTAGPRGRKRACARASAFFVILPPVPIGQRTTTLGGTTLKLHYVGRNLSNNSLVMRLPKEKIAFAVAFIATQSVFWRSMPDSWTDEPETSLKRVLAMGWERLIPAHPAPAAVSAPTTPRGSPSNVERYCLLYRGGFWRRAHFATRHHMSVRRALPSWRRRLPVRSRWLHRQQMEEWRHNEEHLTSWVRHFGGDGRRRLRSLSADRVRRTSLWSARPRRPGCHEIQSRRHRGHNDIRRRVGEGARPRMGQKRSTRRRQGGPQDRRPD